MKHIGRGLLSLALIWVCAHAMAGDAAPRKDLQYLNAILAGIQSPCRIKEINDREIVGFGKGRQRSAGTVVPAGTIVYNGKIAGILGLHDEVMTYAGVIDGKTYRKAGKFVKYYDDGRCL